MAWKARFVLFLGFALLAGGLAGSVVRSSTSGGCLNTDGTDCYGAQVPGPGLSAADALLWDCEYRGKRSGYAEVCSPGSILHWTVLTEHSTVVLWISQNMEDDYTYNLAL